MKRRRNDQMLSILKIQAILFPQTVSKVQKKYDVLKTATTECIKQSSLQIEVDGEKSNHYGVTSTEDTTLLN